jgi:hypothetical protein
MQSWQTAAAVAAAVAASATAATRPPPLGSAVSSLSSSELHDALQPMPLSIAPPTDGFGVTCRQQGPTELLLLQQLDLLLPSLQQQLHLQPSSLQTSTSTCVDGIEQTAYEQMALSRRPVGVVSWPCAPPQVTAYHTAGCLCQYAMRAVGLMPQQQETVLMHCWHTPAGLLSPRRCSQCS